MADTADFAAQLVDEHIAGSLQRIDRAIPAGVAGECEGCGYAMPRLVDGQCGFCRDGRLPPDDWEPPSIALQPHREIVTMPAKSIQLPADAVTAIEAIEALASTRAISFGRAAAELIEQGLASAAPAGAVPDDTAMLTPFQRAWFARGGSLDSLFEELIVKAEGSDQSGELMAATERADAAEARLERLKAALA